MANYSNLKAAIAAAIKTNGNQEITGQVLQDVLTSMVSVIGANYTFAGVATPSTNPGTPDQNVVYMASQAGTYTNFGGIELPDGISLLMWNGTWTRNTVMCGDSAQMIGFETVLELNVVSGTQSYQAPSFAENTFVHGTKLAFVVLDKNNVINKYAFITEYGATIDETLDNPYRYSTNTIYVLDPSTYWATRKTRFFVNETNAIGTGSVTILCAASLKSLLKLIDDVDVKVDTLDVKVDTLSSKTLPLVDSIGFDNILSLEITSGSDSHTSLFPENTFTHGKKLAFVVLDKNNVINKYAFITSAGATIDGTLDNPYRYSTNTIYMIDPSSWWATRKTMFYVNSSNILASGTVTILYSTSIEKLLKLIDDVDVKVDTLDVKVDTLSSKTLPLVDSIGFDNILSLEITSGSDSHTSLFPKNTFTHGKKLAFVVLDKNNVINKYAFITEYGATIDGTLDNPYRYSTNTIYMIDPSSWWATRKTMFYVNSSNILASGTVTILYSTSIEKLLKLIDGLDLSSAATPFAGKKYAVIGDSLSVGGIWEEKMSDITKAVYVSGYSKAGLATLTIGGGSNMDRALLLHQEQPNIDMIFVENINDSTQLGVIGQKTDVPFMLSQRVSSATVYTSSTEALAALATEIAAITPQLGTMLNVRYTSGSETKNVSRCFISKDLSEWNDLSKWVHTYNVSLYSLYKGMYQYLKQNFPNALIFQLIFPRIVWGSSTPKMADGNVDWDEYQDTIGLPALREFQIDVANYCNIPYIDVVTNCNINTYNASQFYPENDVHPNNNGYYRFGETIARIL